MDYSKLGLRIGLELHQQLDTRTKLFCNCPNLMRDPRESNLEFQRYLRISKSELGELDPAALEEIKYGRKFIYKAYDTTCLVEYDEEPPRELNLEALEIALQIGLLLNMQPLDEIHVMRKIVIDGSNTTGFQRTALIALDGWIQTDWGKLGIKSLCLEEDSAQKLSEDPKSVVYSLDRLGIPLIEVATESSIQHPAQAKEVAHHLGMIFRSTKVKHGIGSIRQDLNVSIKEGARIELKGIQELELIQISIIKEVERQLSLIELSKKLLEQGAHVESSGSKIWLRNFGSFDQNSVLIRELEDRASRFGSILDWEQHGDDLCLRLESGNINHAYRAVVERAEYALKGVPPETRKVMQDGTSRYLRPLPGPARMYPETDVPPIRISREWIRELSSRLPETIPHRAKRYIESGLSSDLAWALARSPRHEVFDSITSIYPWIPRSVVASTLIYTLQELKHQGLDPERIRDEDLIKIFGALAQSKISKEAIPQILREIQHGNLDEIISRYHSTLDLDRLLDQLLDRKLDLIKERGERAFSALMGIAMGQVRGKIDGALVAQKLRSKLAQKIRSLDSQIR